MNYPLPLSRIERGLGGNAGPDAMSIGFTNFCQFTPKDLETHLSQDESLTLEMDHNLLHE